MSRLEDPLLRPARIIIVIAALFGATMPAAQAPRFPPGVVWHQDIRTAPLHPQSQSMIDMLAGLGGWGNGNRFQIDFSLHMHPGASPGAPSYPVQAHTDGYWLPDCEPLGTPMPVPADAAFEGQNGLSCDNSNDDCHLLVRQGDLLYELYNGNLSGDVLNGRCLAVWNLSAVYPPAGRGDHCTSADAAGFPIAPLLVNADGVQETLNDPDGDLGHAIRFVLPNARMASDTGLGGVGGRLYVRPASHAGGPSGPVGSVPYGARLRLKADFDMNGYNPAARVILRTMQHYGIVLADGGNIALTFESDRHTATKWSDLGIGPHVFWEGDNGSTPLSVTHFEIIDTGPRIAETYDCERTPIDPFNDVFADRFQQ